MHKRYIFFYLLLSVFITACDGASESGQGSSANTEDENKTDNPVSQSTSTEAIALDETALSKKFKWKMTTTWPANFPIFQEGAEKFAEDVRSISNGRLDI